MAALASDRTSWQADGILAKRRWTTGWIGAVVLLALLIGYRYEVGGDWLTYIGYLNRATDVTLGEALSYADPGYMLLNWVSAKLGWGIVGVNLAGGTIFALGIAQFCRSLPRPWLALAVAMPYLVIVVGMGYARQGIALSLVLLGILALRKEKISWFFVWVLIGAAFHKTAVLMLPIAALAASRNRWWTIGWAAVVTGVGYSLLLSESVDALYDTYLGADFQSEGALIRLLMNALPAVLLLSRSHRFAFRRSEASLWRWFALISLSLLGVLFATSASTAVDRIALYMLPLQMVVFSHLPAAWAPNNRGRQLNIVLIILGYYSAVLGVWLFLATHAKYWLPYRFYPVEGLF